MSVLCKHAHSRIGSELTDQWATRYQLANHHQYFCEPKWKQTNMHKLMGKFVLTNKCFKQLERNEKTWENTIVQRSLLATRFMLELQKLLIKYSSKGVCLLLGSFPFFITFSSLHGNYGWRLGVSSMRDASSNRHIMVKIFQFLELMSNGSDKTFKVWTYCLLYVASKHVIQRFPTCNHFRKWFKFHDLMNTSMISQSILSIKLQNKSNYLSEISRSRASKLYII